MVIKAIYSSLFFLPSDGDLKSFSPVRLFISVEQKQFLRPATGVFPVKSDAQDGGRMFFIHIFGGFRKPPKIWAFFPD